MYLVLTSIYWNTENILCPCRCLSHDLFRWVSWNLPSGCRWFTLLVLRSICLGKFEALKDILRRHFMMMAISEDRQGYPSFDVTCSVSVVCFWTPHRSVFLHLVLYVIRIPLLDERLIQITLLEIYSVGLCGMFSILTCSLLLRVREKRNAYRILSMLHFKQSPR
jgi:hypothetical protein